MKVGFIGLGIMGKPMAENLLKAGHQLRVSSHSDKAYAEMERLGAVCCKTPAETAQDVDVLVLMLPDSPQGEEVLFGANGAAQTLRGGAVVIDMSSVSPEFSRSAAERLKKQGVDMLDAPVSGGEQGAIDGALTIMVGGEEHVYETCRELLLSMGKCAVLVGDIGSGNVCKLANQIIVAATLSGIGEAMALVKKQGVSQQKVFESIRGGLAGSALLEAKAPNIIQDKFVPGFKMKLQTKDLRNAVKSEESCGAKSCVARQALDMMESLEHSGRGEIDHSGVYLYFAED